MTIGNWDSPPPSNHSDDLTDINGYTATGPRAVNRSIHYRLPIHSIRCMKIDDIYMMGRLLKIDKRGSKRTSKKYRH